MRIALLALLGAAFVMPLLAQTAPTSPAESNSDLQKADDFRRLFEERERLGLHPGARGQPGDGTA